MQQFAGNRAVAELLQRHGDGEALPSGERRFFEKRLGQDFSAVRVHHDDRAAGAAAHRSARAYTVGPEIVFGRGQYQPGTEPGRALLAHELAHVVQQQRGGSPPGVEGSHAERGAETVAASVAAGRAVGGVPGGTAVGAAAQQMDPRHARGYVGEQGAGFEHYSAKEGWFFVEGPSGGAGHGVTASGFDGVAYNPKLDELHLVDNKSLKAAGNVRSATAIDPSRNLMKNLDGLIKRVGAMRDMPSRIRILQLLRQAKAALAAGTKLPAQVRLVVTSVGGRSTGVSARLTRLGVIFVPQKGAPAAKTTATTPAKTAKAPAAKGKAPAAKAKAPAAKTAGKAPGAKTKAPTAKTTTKAPTAKTTTKAPTAKTTTKAPARKAATKAPARKAATKAPATKTATKAPTVEPPATKAPAPTIEPPATKAPAPTVEPPAAKPPPAATVEPPAAAKVPSGAVAPERIQVPGGPPVPEPVAPAPRTAAPAVETVRPPLPTGSPLKAGLKAGAWAAGSVLIFMGLQYLVHKKLEEELDKNLEMARKAQRGYAQRVMKKEHPDKPIYLILEVRSEDYSRFIPLVGWMPEPPTLGIWRADLSLDPLPEPILKVKDERLNPLHPGMSTSYTWSELAAE
jgi:hypothetical protein